MSSMSFYVLLDTTGSGSSHLPETHLSMYVSQSYARSATFDPALEFGINILWP